MGSDQLRTLETRLESLERRVNDKIDEGREQQTLVDKLIVVNDKVRALTAGRSKFGDIGRELAKLDDVLTNPVILDEKVDDNHLAEVVLKEEDRLQKEAILLDHITNSQKALDSKAVRDYVQFEPNLNEIRINTLRQHEHTRRINADARKLIETYNQVMVVLKQQLAGWDEKLKRVENERRDNGGRKKSIVEDFD